MASLSKRAQARTEKELHDLLRAPGNATCADCGARNPSWASWNLGVFLCMRCASIHRKLGTHISKVKSLSMDTWSNDQLEAMRKNGNLAVNQVYNPKNKKPDMPLDADEADGVMERFIRKKYQEKSLSDGKPEVPSRDDAAPFRSRSPDTSSPPPVVPVKKSRLFGFGLRSSSSAYPLSKHDKKHRNAPKVDNTLRTSSEDYRSGNRTTDSRAEMSDYDLQVKLSQLRDMGFSDNERNTNILKRNNGDVERTIASLVKLGPSEPPTQKKSAPAPVSTTNSDFPTTSTPTQTSVSAPQSASLSNNPYGQFNQPSNFGSTFGGTAPQTNLVSTNPWQSAVSAQSNTGLEQSFSNMQVSQPLFPHSTGGHPGQVQYTPQTAPSMPSIPQQYTQQYAMTSSPVSVNNPFMQTPMSTQSTGSNPYASHMQQNIPSFAPSTNPFLSMSTTTNQQAISSNQGFNPFGLPPSNSPPQARSQPVAPQPQQNVFDAQSAYSQNVPQSSPYGGVQYGTHQQLEQSGGSQSPPGLPNFQNAQPQTQQFQQQQQQQQQQSPMGFQHQQNPYFQPQQQLSPPPQQPQQQQFANSQSQFNPFYQQQPQHTQPQQTVSPPLPSSPPQQQLQQPQPQPPQQQQPLMPQQTGHLDKKSILALYNYPQLAPPKPLASVPESTDSQNQTPQQSVSPTPSSTIYNGNNVNSTKRSVTMPASSMHSAGGTGNRNPFMGSVNSSGASTPSTSNQQYAGYSQGVRHASHESMAVNNPNLQDGRHSPDAFASLSARYMR